MQNPEWPRARRDHLALTLGKGDTGGLERGRRSFEQNGRAPPPRQRWGGWRPGTGERKWKRPVPGDWPFWLVGC